MNDILDYIEWRGDLSFAEAGFNEVDNLVLSVLAYLAMDEVVPPEAGPPGVELRQAAEEIQNLAQPVLPALSRTVRAREPRLLSAAARSRRFGSLRLSGYRNEVDLEEAKQFAAVVFSWNDTCHFVAFRGTDASIAGWKEDFEMSFRPEVQSQRRAGEYLGTVAPRLPGHLRAGGHSKGGNLAVSAAARADPQTQERIIALYNNDGPGFQTEMLESPGYQRIRDRVTTLLPRSSVVGLLLEHDLPSIVVRSSELGILQHNPFSWHVRGPAFVRETGLSRVSLGFNRVLRGWLAALPVESRAEFVGAVFDILQATGAKTLRELSQDRLARAEAMIRAYRGMDSETQTLLRRTVELFFLESQRSLRSSIAADVGSLVRRVRSFRPIGPRRP